MWNARLLWAVSSRVYIEARHSGTDNSLYVGPPQERRAGPPAHFDRATGVKSVNYETHSTGWSRPITSGAYVTYMTPSGGSQRHEIGAGVEYQHIRLVSESGYIGGRWFFDVDGIPETVQLSPDAPDRLTQTRTNLVRAGRLESHKTIDYECRRARQCLRGQRAVSWRRVFSAHYIASAWPCLACERAPRDRTSSTLRTLPRSDGHEFL